MGKQPFERGDIMAKVKRILTIVGASLLSLAFVSSMAFLFSRSRDKVEYNVTYVAVQNGTVTDIHPDFYKNGGSYPSEYVSGVGATIDDLNGYVYVSAYEDRTFKGWYLDSACTEAFDGTIDKEAVGDITLYAKISVGYWTKNY